MKKGDVLSAVNRKETDTEKTSYIEMEKAKARTGNRDVEGKNGKNGKNGKGIFLKNSEGKTISSMNLKDTYQLDKDLRPVFSVKESKTDHVRVSLIPMSDVVKLKLKIKGFSELSVTSDFMGLTGVSWPQRRACSPLS